MLRDKLSCSVVFPLVLWFALLVAPNGWAETKDILLGDSVSGALEASPADTDILTFPAAAGTKIKLTILLNVNATVSLFGPGGSTVGGLVNRTRTGNRGTMINLSGTLSADGSHALVITAQGGATGSYSVKTRGNSPSRVTSSGNATAATPATVQFYAVAGSQLRNIKVSGDVGLNSEGLLTGPTGGTVNLAGQSPNGKRLLAKGADLAMTGTYTFTFTPAGSGPFTAQVAVRGPRSKMQYTLTGDASGQPSIPGTGVSAQMSTPANGESLVAGESSWVRIALTDDDGNALSVDDLSTLALYIHGPKDQSTCTTAVKLLRATTDRNANPHHYINLLKSSEVVIFSNVVMYPLSPVTDELPGTYTTTVRATLKSDALAQFLFQVDFQIGSASPETNTVSATKCGACHLGADNGKMYMHHIDPGHSPTGSPSLDSNPVESCKPCHNQDGYAGYNNGANSRIDNNTAKTPDPIIRRAHGVHMGEGLLDPFNKDGDFADYANLVFPAGIKNCTTCHVDDRYLTRPSRQACGSCHDNVWFGDSASTPASFVNHSGGPTSSDPGCNNCHAAGGPGDTAAKHATAPLAFDYNLETSITPPANGTHYEDGEMPVVTVVVKDPATGNVIDPTTLDNAAIPGRFRLAVYGPISGQPVPVLTNVADHKIAGDTTSGSANVTNVDAGAAANLYAGLGVYGPGIPSSTTVASVAGTTVTLNKNATATATGVELTFGGSGSYGSVDLRTSNTDPRLSRDATKITYQLEDVKDLTPGTYLLGVQVRQGRGAPMTATHAEFQALTATADAKKAGNCADCHGSTTMHDGLPFSLAPYNCMACHDYRDNGTGKDYRDGGSSRWGYENIQLYVHQLHYGHYLDSRADRNNANFEHFIFPQDVRNCTKCHTSDSWKEKPSRLACTSCHNGDGVRGHAKLMTFDPTPDNTYSGDELEACATCHNPEEDHNISSPYVPPYPRSPGGH